MSSHNQAILDIEVATLERAQALSSDILRWLIDERIVEDRLCDRCLGKGLCYPPGPRFMQACGGIESDSGDGNYASFSKMRTNGMGVVVGRNFILNTQGQFKDVTCPRCAAQVPNEDFWNAGDRWCKGKTDTLQCPHCGQASSLPQWIHPDIGYTMLAFEFWNWDPLSDTFIEAIAKRLGHRITVIKGKV